VEEAALDLLALVALAAAEEEPAVAALAPRLARAGGAEPPSPLAVELVLEAGGVRGRCRLLVPAAVVAALCPPAAELAPPLAAAEVEGVLAGGSALLAPGELETLEPGDVLVLDEAPGPVALFLPGFALRGREGEEVLHVEEIAVTETSSSLPATLLVEVARARVTLGDLSRVEPGAVLPLHAPRDGRVALRLGDRVVARGRLVEVDGALGVAVDSLGDEP
jgi:type III secretion protein Q